MKTISPTLKKYIETIEAEETAYLGTIDADGFPSVRAMLNLRNSRLYPHLVPLYAAEENPATIYLTTNTSSAKISEIDACGKACVYYCKPGSFEGIMLTGNVEVVTDSEFKRSVWMKGWTMYYPGGIDSEDFSMLRFVPEKVKRYAGFTVKSEAI